MGAQMIARANELIEGVYLKSKMMQLFVYGPSRGRTDKGEAMMVRMAAQENHPTGHHLFGINIRELKTEDLSIKIHGSFKVANLHDHMPQLGDPKRHAHRSGGVF